MQGVAFITGAASGIGAATAVGFQRQGVRRFILVDIRLEPLEETVVELRRVDETEILALQCDVTNEEDVKRCVQQGAERFGRIDYAVNSAGITNKSLVGDYKTADWNRVINVNQTGVFYCMREQLAQMVKQEPLLSDDPYYDPRRAQRGSIVNICSINSLVAARRNAAYVTSKHAIVGLTKTCALDYAAEKIRCNGVAPGYIETALTLLPENIDVLHSATRPEKTPQGRPGTTAEIADVVVFLSGPGASFVNGACWTIDGGFTLL